MKLRHALLPALFLSSLAGALLAWLPISSFERSTVTLRNRRGMPLRVVLLEPPAAAVPRPAVAIFQPLNNPPETGYALGLELVRHGVLVALIDFRGKTTEENRRTLREDALGIASLDAAAVLQYLRARPDVDGERIGLAGHSVGGTMAIRAGMEQPWVRAVAAVGIAGDVTHELPRNLLWMVGLYDEFRPLLAMQRVMEASNAEHVAVPFHTAGDFRTGTARRLAVSSTADHFTELADHRVVTQSMAWFTAAFDGSVQAPRRGAVAPWFYACYPVVFVSGWLLALRGLRAGAERRPWLAPRSRLFTLAAMMMLGAVMLVPAPRLSILRADVALWGLILVVVYNAGLRAGRMAWLPLLAWLSFFTTLVINQVASYVSFPRMLLDVPEFAFWHATGLANSYLLVYPRALLFSDYTSAIIRPGMLLLAMMAAELAKPGLLGSVRGKLGKEAATRDTTGRRGTNWKGWAAVIAAFAVLGIVTAMRVAQGFVNREALELAGWVILRFAVPSFFIFTLLKRLLWRQQAA